MNPVQSILKDAGFYKDKIIKISLVGDLIKFQEFNSFFKNFSVANNHADAVVTVPKLYSLFQSRCVPILL
jgi:enamine deaminase RidA (YjgF/YER057c/UK114 family)